MNKLCKPIALLLIICISLLVPGCSNKGKSDVLQDGTYEAYVTLEGGSGKAYVESPATVTVEGGNASAIIVWSSPYYDYMIVDDEKYINEADEGNSTFTIPIPGLPSSVDVIGDTTAMSTPHEIEYTLTFSTKE